VEGLEHGARALASRRGEQRKVAHLDRVGIGASREQGRHRGVDGLGGDAIGDKQPEIPDASGLRLMVSL
jgi:hypothetical protein